MTVKWRGKPVFIRHRTANEIATAQSEDNVDLRDPQTDAERCKDPKYLGNPFVVYIRSSELCFRLQSCSESAHIWAVFL